MLVIDGQVCTSFIDIGRLRENMMAKLLGNLVQASQPSHPNFPKESQAEI
jgi:hypothetical protein